MCTAASFAPEQWLGYSKHSIHVVECMNVDDLKMNETSTYMKSSRRPKIFTTKVLIQGNMCQRMRD